MSQPAHVTVSPRIALLLINVLSVYITRLEAQAQDPNRPPISLPGFGKLYHFESSITNANLVAELSDLRSALFDGSIDEAVRRQLADLDDPDNYLNR